MRLVTSLSPAWRQAQDKLYHNMADLSTKNPAALNTRDFQ